MAQYRLQGRGAGVIDTTTGAFIPPATGNRHWQAYLAWVEEGNTPDPALEAPLADARGSAKAALALEAEARYQARFAELYQTLDAKGPVSAWVVAIEREEAVAADADGTPTSSEYPFLDARATAKSSSIATEATAVLAQYDSWKTEAAAIRRVLLTAFEAIDAAGSTSAVDAIVEAVEWPGFLEPDPVVVAVSLPAVVRSPATPSPVVVEVALPAPTVSTS